MNPLTATPGCVPAVDPAPGADIHLDARSQGRTGIPAPAVW